MGYIARSSSASTLRDLIWDDSTHQYSDEPFGIYSYGEEEEYDSPLNDHTIEDNEYRPTREREVTPWRQILEEQPIEPLYFLCHGWYSIEDSLPERPTLDR